MQKISFLLFSVVPFIARFVYKVDWSHSVSSLGLGVSVTVPEIIHTVTYSIYYCITHHSLKELSVASEIKPVYFQCTNLVLFFVHIH